MKRPDRQLRAFFERHPKLDLVDRALGTTLGAFLSAAGLVVILGLPGVLPPAFLRVCFFLSLVVFWAIGWRMLHDRSQPSDEVEEVLAALEEQHDVRVGILLVASVLLFAAGLVLDSLDVAVGGLPALIGLAGIMLAIFVAQWTSPRRRYRDAAMLSGLGESLQRRAAGKG